MATEHYVLIVAGGAGVRLGGEPKQFRLLGGRPLLCRTLETYYTACPEAHFLVVLPAGHRTAWRRLCVRYGCSIAHRCVAGGRTRSGSVRRGLEAIQAKEALVAIHDGVRPFLRASVLQEAFSVAQKKGNAVPVVALSDSLRLLHAKDSNKSIDRDQYRAVQTPQVFGLAALRAAFAATKGQEFQDEAARMEATGEAIHLIAGDPLHFKITGAFEWRMAQSYLSAQTKD